MSLLPVKYEYILPFIARQCLCKNVTAATNISINKELLDAYVSLYICNNSLKNFQQQQRVAGGVIFYTVHVISKKGN
jgi:hypothetical protein